jgi:hypothetical protein
MHEDQHVEPQDEARRNSPKAAAGGDVLTAESAAAETAGQHEACYWNDKKYSDGATLCDAHTRYECWNGKWVEIGLC